MQCNCIVTAQMRCIFILVAELHYEIVSSWSTKIDLAPNRPKWRAYGGKYSVDPGLYATSVKTRTQSFSSCIPLLVN